MFASVVVGTDGSDTAADAVRSATVLAKLLSATLHIVTVYRPRPVRAAGVPDGYRHGLGPGDKADALLDDQCARARAQGVNVEGDADGGPGRGHRAAWPSRRKPISSWWGTRAWPAPGTSSAASRTRWPIRRRARC